MSFEVTVTPQVYNVEVEVNPSVQPFDVVVEVGNVPDLDLTTNGDSGASTFDPLTGELNIPEYTLDGLGGVPESRTITINGTTQDLSADRTFTIPAPDPVTIGSPANGLAIDGNQVLTIGLASGSTNGALSSTDWTTFNGKQNALTNPITGTGASGQVAFFNGTSSQTGSNNLFWDNVNGRLGVGTNAPSNTLNIVGNTATFDILTWKSSTGNTGYLGSDGGQIAITTAPNGGGSFLAMNANNFTMACGSLWRALTAGAERMRIPSTGNVLINTFTDAGFRLDVNGAARVQGNLTTNLTAGSVPFIGASGLLTQDNSNLFWDNTNKILRVGSTTALIDPFAKISLINDQAATVQQLISFSNTLSHRVVFQGVKARNTSASPSGVGAGDFITTFLSGAYDGSSVQFSAGLFFDAESNASAGNAPQQINLVTGTAGANRTTKLQVRSNGNVIIQNGGTFTDAGFGLDVNGTARVQGDLTISDTRNIILATGTGTKIGTSTSQKLSLWNATPNVQPTTAITAGAFVANTSGITDDTATFGGYTMGQVVAALRRIGALA